MGHFVGGKRAKNRQRPKFFSFVAKLDGKSLGMQSLREKITVDFENSASKVCRAKKSGLNSPKIKWGGLRS